jgi:hypothetical protein
MAIISTSVRNRRVQRQEDVDPVVSEPIAPSGAGALAAE